MYNPSLLVSERNGNERGKELLYVHCKREDIDNTGNVKISRAEGRR